MKKLYKLNLTEGKIFFVVYQGEYEDLLYSIDFGKRGAIYDFSEPEIKTIVQNRIKDANYFF